MNTADQTSSGFIPSRRGGDQEPPPADPVYNPDGFRTIAELHEYARQLAVANPEQHLQYERLCRTRSIPEFMAELDAIQKPDSLGGWGPSDLPPATPPPTEPTPSEGPREVELRSFRSRIRDLEEALARQEAASGYTRNGRQCGCRQCQAHALRAQREADAADRKAEEEYRRSLPFTVHGEPVTYKEWIAHHRGDWR